MMKKLIFILVIILYSSYNILLYSQSSQESAIKEGEWKWYIVEDFEQCYNWPIINRTDYEKEWIYKNPRLTIQKGSSKKLDADKKDSCLGARIIIDFQGDTREFIIPVFPIKLKGLCKNITFWVCSGNKPLTIRVMFKDYWNTLYMLEPTEFTLDYYGWKKFEINDLDKKIINQLPTIAPDYKPLEIIAFVIENPQHKLFYDPVYIYIDQLKAFTRADEFTDYDGADMPNRW